MDPANADDMEKLVRSALSSFPLEVVALTLIADEWNTTFRAETIDGESYAVRCTCRIAARTTRSASNGMARGTASRSVRRRATSAQGRGRIRVRPGWRSRGLPAGKGGGERAGRHDVRVVPSVLVAVASSISAGHVTSLGATAFPMQPINERLIAQSGESVDAWPPLSTNELDGVARRQPHVHQSASNDDPRSVEALCAVDKNPSSRGHERGDERRHLADLRVHFVVIVEREAHVESATRYGRHPGHLPVLEIDDHVHVETRVIGACIQPRCDEQAGNDLYHLHFPPRRRGYRLPSHAESVGKAVGSAPSKSQCPRLSGVVRRSRACLDRVSSKSPD
jgi:hypothetical protein